MLLVEIGMGVVLSRAPERCEIGETCLRLDSTTDKVLLTADWSAEPSLMVSADLETALALDLSLVKEVRHVLAERADNSLLVWIALDNPVREVRERIFQKELSLIEGFPEIDFDFNIVPSMGHDPHYIASSAKVIYTRKEGDLAKQG